MNEQNIHAGAEQRATERVSWWLGGSLSGPGAGEDPFYGERTCRKWERMVTIAHEQRLAAIEDGVSDEQAMRDGAYQLAADLKEWAEDEIGDEPRRGLVGELVGYMLACVDWQQLATDALEEEARQQA